MTVFGARLLIFFVVLCHTDKTTYIHPESGLKYTWNTEEQVWKSDDGEVLLPSTDWSERES